MSFPNMAQETRKDPRAKVLTVTVRYKSATLDEFIEHHSHDVSRGGMFIKTNSPFPSGTLLKIEVRIAGDQRVMQGVGRVVWKRESAEAQDGAPAGMGVKFIKIDDASRSVIDQLVAKAGGAVSAFDKGTGEGTQPAAPAAPPAAASATGAPRPAIRKATMIGLGALGSDTGSADESKAEEPAKEGFFPDTGDAEQPAPEDRTVMKQAAELLQDALREAGGSLDEIGAPTVAASGTPGASSHPPEPVREPPRPTKSEAPAEAKKRADAKSESTSEAGVTAKPAEKAEKKPSSSRPPGGTRPASGRPAGTGTARRSPVAVEPIPGEGGNGKLVATAGHQRSGR